LNGELVGLSCGGAGFGVPKRVLAVGADDVVEGKRLFDWGAGAVDAVEPKKLLIGGAVVVVGPDLKKLLVGGVGAGVEPKVMLELDGCPEV